MCIRLQVNLVNEKEWKFHMNDTVVAIRKQQKWQVKFSLNETFNDILFIWFLYNNINMIISMLDNLTN